MANVLIPVQAETVSIRVTDIDTSRGGNILVLVYDGDGFPKDHSKANYKALKVAATPTLNFNFSVDFEEYAVKVLHDEDETGEVTKNWTGFVPAEGLGFSNGARLSLKGPHSFRRAKLPVSANELSIKIKYPR